MGTVAVFAYGSLVDPESFELTLGRKPAVLQPARLHGWRRRWSVMRDNLAAEKTFARHPDGELPPYVIGLNLEPDDGNRDVPGPNGALIEVEAQELSRLDLRELRYDRVELTDAVTVKHEFDAVFGYTAKPDHFAPRPPEGAVAMAPYLRLIKAAFRELGDGEWELFLETTGLPPVEAIEPVLVRDEIPPGNPRAW
jgi:cation transport regulator ChaC